MHRFTKLMLVASIVAVPLLAQAHAGYLTTFDTKYGTTGTRLDVCGVCHGATNSTWNPYGTAVMNHGSATNLDAALTAVEPLDSDGDTYSNITEIHALTFPGNAADHPTTTSAPKIALSPTSLSFGTVNVGSTASQSVSISNTGNAALSISSIARCSGTSTEYSFSPTYLGTIAPGGSTTLTVSYAPVDSGTDSGCVAVTSNDTTNSPVNVSVTGSGQSVITYCVDADLDGYYVIANGCTLPAGAPTQSDCNDNNAAVNPGAAEICTNGIDDNCNGLVDSADPACPAPTADYAITGLSVTGTIALRKTATVNVDVALVSGSGGATLDVTATTVVRGKTKTVQIAAAAVVGTAGTYSYAWKPSASGTWTIIATVNDATAGDTNDSGTTTVVVP